MLINEYVELELHKQRTQNPEKVEGNRILAEIITEFKNSRREQNRKQSRK